MKIPNIKYNDKFLDSISWFMKIGGITLFPYIILRERYRDNSYYVTKYTNRIINHESIHIQQQMETLIIPFFIWYIVEWFIKSIIYLSTTRGYQKISFEQEANEHEEDINYLKTRKRFSWIRYIFK